MLSKLTKLTNKFYLNWTCTDFFARSFNPILQQ